MKKNVVNYYVESRIDSMSSMISRNIFITLMAITILYSVLRTNFSHQSRCGRQCMAELTSRYLTRNTILEAFAKRQLREGFRSDVRTNELLS